MQCGSYDHGFRPGAGTGQWYVDGQFNMHEGKQHTTNTLTYTFAFPALGRNQAGQVQSVWIGRADCCATKFSAYNSSDLPNSIHTRYEQRDLVTW